MLDPATVDRDPLRQFQAWFEEARSAGVARPDAMTLATASADGRPSARVVLLKRADGRGFVFHTGYESRKGRELAANPQAALLFHWSELGRQVRIEGRVERAAPEESDAYFRTRPRGRQLGTLASAQSEVLGSREELEARVAELGRGYEGRDVPRPSSWGAFRLDPDAFEFWERHPDRLHDRVRYRRDGPAWLIERLAP